MKGSIDSDITNSLVVKIGQGTDFADYYTVYSYIQVNEYHIDRHSLGNPCFLSASLPMKGTKQL
jgi:hypothetical protein